MVFFESWDSVWRIVLTVLVAYPGLIILLSVHGKRALSKMNMFDFVITVALGSTFGSTIIFEEVTIVDSLVTFSLLLLAQFLVEWAAMRWEFAHHLIKADPTLLYLDGEFLDEDMRAVRVAKSDIWSAVRQNGLACMSSVHAVVLETNGSLSVLSKKDDVQATTLQGISNHEML